tara:strand:+ start:5175 stop:5453 length:279 start_codon:yes stop_codon:yes gene_type:complete
MDIEGFDIRKSVAVIHAFMLYDYNQHKDIILEAIYGLNMSEGYMEEKLDLLNRRGLLWLFGQLDGSHRLALLKAVLKQYAKESSKATGIRNS